MMLVAARTPVLAGQERHHRDRPEITWRPSPGAGRRRAPNQPARRRHHWPPAAERAAARALARRAVHALRPRQEPAVLTVRHLRPPLTPPLLPVEERTPVTMAMSSYRSGLRLIPALAPSVAAALPTLSASGPASAAVPSAISYPRNS